MTAHCGGDTDEHFNHQHTHTHTDGLTERSELHLLNMLLIQIHSTSVLLPETCVSPETYIYIKKVSLGNTTV